MNKITMTLQVDHLILEALKEDISSEDVNNKFCYERSSTRRSRTDL